LLKFIKEPTIILAMIIIIIIIIIIVVIIVIISNSQNLFQTLLPPTRPTLAK